MFGWEPQQPAILGQARLDGECLSAVFFLSINRNHNFTVIFMEKQLGNLAWWFCGFFCSVVCFLLDLQLRIYTKSDVTSNIIRK